MTGNDAHLSVRNPDIVQAELKRRHDTDGLKWRDISNLDEYSGIPAGTLCSIAKTGIVPKRWYKRLGMTEMKPAPVCPVHNVVHQYDCQTQQVVTARNGRKPAKRPRPSYKRICLVLLAALNAYNSES